MVSSILLACGWAYAGAILLWWVLLKRYGDSLWWLALLTPFAPLLFMPAVLLLVGAIFITAELLLPFLLVLACFLWQYRAYFWPNLNHPKEPFSATADKRAFTVMTFNIWWMSKSRATAKGPLLNTINRSTCAASSPQTADLVALQELQPKMADLLLAEVGHLYPYHCLDVTGERLQRLGVFSRFPLETMDGSHLQARDFRIQIVRVNFPHQPFVLYNIHPRATNVIRYLRTPSSFVKRVQQSFAEREKFFRQLLADVEKRDEPVLVVGDFNSTDLSDVYHLMSKKLIDAHRSAGWGLGYTFPAHGADFKGLPVPRRFMRLDMIFHSDEFLAKQCRVGREHGESDHLPVLAEVVLRSES